jgi:hypothetical protein
MLLDCIAFQKEAWTHAINATMGGNSGYRGRWRCRHSTLAWQGLALVLVLVLVAVLSEHVKTAVQQLRTALQLERAYLVTRQLLAPKNQTAQLHTRALLTAAQLRRVPSRFVPLSEAPLRLLNQTLLCTALLSRLSPASPTPTHEGEPRRPDETKDIR